MTDPGWVLVGAVVVFGVFVELLIIGCLKQLELIHQRLRWIHEDIREIGGLTE